MLGLIHRTNRNIHFLDVFTAVSKHIRKDAYSYRVILNQMERDVQVSADPCDIVIALKMYLTRLWMAS